ALGAGVLPYARGDLFEPVSLQHGPDPAHPLRREPQDPVDPGLARSASVVPRPGTQVDPVAAPARLVRGILVVVLTAHLQREQEATVAADHQHRAVLALTVVLLVADPGPHHLARAGELVVHRVVRDLGHAFGGAAVGGPVLLDGRPAPVPPGAGRGPCAAECSGQAFQDGHALTIASAC